MHKPLKVTVISVNPETRAYFEKSSGSRLQYTVLAPEPGDVIDEAPAGAEVLLLELETLDALCEAIAAVKSADSAPVIYGISAENDTDAVRQVMRAGAADVFMLPLVADEITRELEQVMEQRDANATGGKLITFLNVKGGNGSTTLAVNAAVDLALRKDIKVLLVDLDIQFGDVAVALDLHPKATVAEAVSQADRLDATLLASLVTRVSDQLDVLASPARLDPLDGVKPREIHKLFETAIDNYDVTIVDLPRVITPWTSEVMRWSDHLFLVAQGCISSVRDSKLITDHLHSLGVADESIHYIHNRAGAKHAAVTADQLTDALGSPRIVVVHNDYDVASRASDMGKPVSDLARSSALVKDIHRLGDIVYGLAGHAEADKPGLLTRLFGAHGEK